MQAAGAYKIPSASSPDLDLDTACDHCWATEVVDADDLFRFRGARLMPTPSASQSWQRTLDTPQGLVCCRMVDEPFVGSTQAHTEPRGQVAAPSIAATQSPTLNVPDFIGWDMHSNSEEHIKQASREAQSGDTAGALAAQHRLNPLALTVRRLM